LEYFRGYELFESAGRTLSPPCGERRRVYEATIARPRGELLKLGIDVGQTTVVPIVNPNRWQLIENRAMLLLDV